MRVMVIDEQGIVRQGLRALFGSQHDMEVVAEADHAAAAVTRARSTQADVVVMDLRLRNGSGIEAIRELRSDNARCGIVVLTNYDDEEHVCGAISAGAQAYLLKDADPSEIVDAVRAVHAGRRYIDATASSRLAERLRASPLTPREHEVLELVTRGESNKSIARLLGIAHDTVKGHIANILWKLDARGRTEAARKAIERGLVRIE